MPEPHRYPLSIAGVGITIQTNEVLPEAAPFSPFLTDSPQPGYLVEYREVNALPEPEGPLLYRCESYQVYSDGAGGFARWYTDGMKGFLRFARAATDWSRKCVLVEYLHSERELVSAMGNCFSFGGWEQLLLRENRLLLHASCVDTPYGGLLFSGPSGIGKSTQAALWEKYGSARLINGDRPILRPTEQGWLAYGSPYAGSSHRHLNECCPVRAVVLLKQAPACSLRRLGVGEGFRKVFAGVTVGTWDAEGLSLACDLVERLVSEIPICELACTPDAAAVELLRRTLEGESNEQKD